MCRDFGKNFVTISYAYRFCERANFFEYKFLNLNYLFFSLQKPANILVMGEGPERGRVKIGDFYCGHREAVLYFSERTRPVFFKTKLSVVVGFFLSPLTLIFENLCLRNSFGNRKFRTEIHK